MVTVGADVYPLPSKNGAPVVDDGLVYTLDGTVRIVSFTKVIADTVVPVKVAIAIAPVPPPPVMVTVGTVV